MKKKITVIALFLSAVLFLQSCDQIQPYIDMFGSSQTEETTEEEEITDAETVLIPRAEFTDPLTGAPTDSDRSKSRPVAIVVKNDRAASPQYGLSRSSVLYEALVEGGLTRFLAVYSDISDAGKVGPVIDSRSYFFDFANNHNAVFVQAGTTKHGNETQVSYGVTALDAIIGDMAPGFYRDPVMRAERGMENSILTDAKGLVSRAQQYGITTTVSTRVLPYTTLDYLQNREMTGGAYCTYLSIPFSTNMTVEYSYSTLTNKYTRSQYGAPHIDAETGDALSFTNIIVIIADHTTIDQASGEMDISHSGRGNGYYVYGGSSIMITWQRTDGENPIKLFEADGLTPLQISSGNTYIAVVSPRLSGKVEFERTAEK